MRIGHSQGFGDTPNEYGGRKVNAII